jgi:hypothetical protein
MLALSALDSRSHELAAIYADPWVAKVGHDHRPAAPITHPAVRYLGAYVGGSLVGAFAVIESGFIELDLHALLTKRALPYCRELGRLCLAHAFGDTAIQRVTAYITEGLESARNYCLKLGFKVEGFRRCAVQKSGRLLGVHVLGLSRQDWEASK